MNTTRPTIKVISPDRMCFDVDAETLEPLSCSHYDAYAFSDPEPRPSVSCAEWNLRLNERRAAQRFADLKASAR